MNPSSYSIRSIRAGGAAALYRATKDIDLSARFGRWGSASISAYLWGIRQMMAGISDHMVTGATSCTRPRIRRNRSHLKTDHDPPSAQNVGIETRGLKVMINRLILLGIRHPSGESPVISVRRVDDIVSPPETEEGYI